MIGRAANFLKLTHNLKSIKYFSTHVQTPTKLQKVEATTVKFNVRNSDGQWQQIHGFIGQSIFEAIVRMKVKGSFNQRYCFGNDLTYRPHQRPHDPFSDGPTCGMCRIVLRDNWYDKVMEQTEGMSTMEQATLYRFSDMRKDVRLSCCIPVEKWMDGCTFEIWAPPELSELTQLH